MAVNVPRLLLAGLTALSACAGAANAVSPTTATCPPAAPCRCPPADAAPRECPTVTAEPGPPPTVQEPARPAILDPEAWPEGTSGWYCWELRRNKGDQVFKSYCARLKPNCEESLASIKRLQFGTRPHFKPCTRYASAHCFMIQDWREKYVELMCHVTFPECAGSWGDTIEWRPYATLTPCEEIQ